MKKVKIAICFLLSAIIMSGCSSEIKEDSVSSEAASLNSAEMEEQELIENMPCIEISHEDFVNSLISSNNFKKQSEDSYMTTLSYKKSNINTEVIYQDTEISVISFSIDPAAVENNTDDLEKCLQNAFELLNFTYSSDIPQVFLDKYEEETKKSEETGSVEPLIGSENSDENWGIVYTFRPEACTIEIRPYGLY
ncbi:MAG: hypothetical protein NC320_04640 [Clostridium sp.]|nr:hypothetical protein [Clostridium sp.]